MKRFNFISTVRLPLSSLVLAIIFACCIRVFAAGEQQFNSPEEAVQALSAAAKANDTNALHRIFGSAAHDLVSPDLVQASAERELFLQRVSEKIEVARKSDSEAVVQLGSDGWPFPIPLVKSGSSWFFDTEAGREEILNRRIGKNELSTIDVCHAYVDAQREYASEDRNGDQVLEFARRLRSSTGTHDGLYWPQHNDEEQSPFGPLIAQARVEGYRHETKPMVEPPETASPYHGYYFKILTRQGKHAPGGKYNYIINGHMIAGFALVAWPAQWDNSGVMTFIVNQQGIVYQKNLGPKTASIAQSMNTYDPDPSWTVAD
jgi:hypothetical protein